MVRHSIVAACIGLCLLTGCAKKPASDSQKVQVVTTVFPIADVVRQVGGDHVEVQCLLDPGASPHDYQIKAKHIAMLQQARLVVRIGMDLDQWALSSSAVAQRQDAQILELSKFANFVTTQPTSAAIAVPHHEEADHDEDHDADHAADRDHAATAPHAEAGHAGHHHHHAGDPHIWLDPVMMQDFTRAIADSLIRLDPAHRADYQRNADAYLAQLRDLDREYRTQLASLTQRSFVTFHESFTYIARRYNLKYAALEPPSATEYTPGQLRYVQEFVADNHIRVIFIEPEFSADRLRQLAAEVGAKVEKLDPQGNPNVPGYDSYLGLMRSNLAAMVAAMK